MGHHKSCGYGNNRNTTIRSSIYIVLPITYLYSSTLSDEWQSSGMLLNGIKNLWEEIPGDAPTRTCIQTSKQLGPRFDVGFQLLSLSKLPGKTPQHHNRDYVNKYLIRSTKAFFPAFYRNLFVHSSGINLKEIPEQRGYLTSSLSPPLLVLRRCLDFIGEQE